MTICELVSRAHENATRHGFWDKPLEFGTSIALIHSTDRESLCYILKKIDARKAVEYVFQMRKTNVLKIQKNADALFLESRRGSPPSLPTR